MVPCGGPDNARLRGFRHRFSADNSAIALQTLPRKNATHSAIVSGLLRVHETPLWEKFDSYDPNQPFTPWACRFALNKARQWIERHRRWKALLDGGLAEELALRHAEGYDFGRADAFVEFGTKQGMKLVGHTLVWHPRRRQRHECAGELAGVR